LAIGPWKRRFHSLHTSHDKHFERLPIHDKEEFFLETRTFSGPSHLAKYQCIGSACEQTCCVKWRIDLNKDTFVKYTQLSTDEFPKKSRSLLKKNPIFSRNQNTYGALDLSQTDACPFFTEEKLCGLQLKYGTDYLSPICNAYPRVTNQIDDHLERCLTLSCPEAARIVLLDTDFEIKTFEEKISTPMTLNKTLDTRKAILLNSEKKHFHALRDYSVSLIKDDSHRLWENLLVLATFFSQLDQKAFGRKSQDFTLWLETFQNKTAGELFAKTASLGYTLEKEKINILTEIFKGLQQKKETIPDYNEVYEMAYTVFGLHQGTNHSEILKTYNHAYGEYYEPFFSDKPYILKNYLLNHIYRDTFPFMFPSTPYNSFIAFIAQYSLIKFHLIGYAAAKKSLTEEDVVRVIYSFSRVFSHSAPFYMNLVKFFQLNFMSSLKYMACLIKE
jgi:lysine-N-methylase